MKINKITSVIALSLAITLAAATGSFAQIGTIWSVVSDCYAFLGNANMDGDTNEELVYFDYPHRIIIYDGMTSNSDWDSGEWDVIYIAGYNYGNAGMGYGGNNDGFSPFCDINNDGIKEITFQGKENSGNPDRIYVVGWGGAGFNSPGGGEVPGIHILSQNYPNPFNPSTTIQYAVTSPGQVVIKIYNSLGQEVSVLLDEYKQAGEYTVNWNGRDESGNSLASGTYFYQIRVGDFVSTKKSIMLK